VCWVLGDSSVLSYDDQNISRIDYSLRSTITWNKKLSDVLKQGIFELRENHFLHRIHYHDRIVFLTWSKFVFDRLRNFTTWYRTCLFIQFIEDKNRTNFNLRTRDRGSSILQDFAIEIFRDSWYNSDPDVQSTVTRMKHVTGDCLPLWRQNMPVVWR